MKFVYASFEKPQFVTKEGIVMRHRVGYLSRGLPRLTPTLGWKPEHLWLGIHINFQSWWADNSPTMVKFYNSLAEDIGAKYISAGCRHIEIHTTDGAPVPSKYQMVFHITTTTAFFNRIGCLPGVVRILKATEVKTRLLYGF